MLPQLLARDLRGEMTLPAADTCRPSPQSSLGLGVAQLLSLSQVRPRGAAAAGCARTQAPCFRGQICSGGVCGFMEQRGRRPGQRGGLCSVPLVGLSLVGGSQAAVGAAVALVQAAW